jgi:CBS domain-containing protein
MSFFEKFANVSDVLNLKFEVDEDHAKILKVPVDASFEALAGYLTDHKIGVAFVYDQSDQIIGLISERDIVAQITRYGPDAFNTPIKTMITREVAHCNLHDKLKMVASRMADEGIRHIAIKDEKDEYIGVVSSRDIELFAGQG